MIQIKKYKPTSHKIKALVYGGTGSGKTSFGGTAPKVIFASAEAGLLSLGGLDIDYVEIKSVQNLRELLKYLQGDHNFETVVLDSITEINDIIKAEIELKKGKPMQLQDWGVLAKDIEKILRAFRGLDMNVIMIAQEKIIEDDKKIAKLVPDLNGKSADKIAYFMDIVGHMEILGDGTHIINISPDPKLVTKDRTRMLGTDTVPDFKKWLEALEDMEIVDTEEIVEELNSEIKKEEKIEEKIEEKSFNQVYNMIKMSANQDHLDEVLSNLRNDINNKNIILNDDQKNEILSLKQDMIKSFESKKPVKKTTKKTTNSK